MKYTREVVWNMLQNEAEEKFAAFSLSLLGEGKENTKVIGVRLPRLRRFSKEIAKTDGKEYLDTSAVVNTYQTNSWFCIGFGMVHVFAGVGLLVYKKKRK